MGDKKDQGWDMQPRQETVHKRQKARNRQHTWGTDERWPRSPREKHSQIPEGSRPWPLFLRKNGYRCIKLNKVFKIF